MSPKNRQPEAWEAFWAFYERTGRFPDGSYVSAKGYVLESQRQRKYRQYLKNCERRAAAAEKAGVRRRKSPAARVDERWEAVREQVLARDRGQCRLLRVLVPFEQAQLIAVSGGLHRQVDCAHYRPRSTHPELKYEADNVFALNRYSHSCLDTGRDPVTGRKISVAEVEAWWQRIRNG